VGISLSALGSRLSVVIHVVVWLKPDTTEKHQSSNLRLNARSPKNIGSVRLLAGPGKVRLKRTLLDALPRCQRSSGPKPKAMSPMPALLHLRFFPRLTQLQPVQRILHQQLAGTFERIVLALRK